MDRRVYVHLAYGGFDGPVGQLWLRDRRGRESASFQYDPRWIQHPRSFAVDPALELRAGPFHTGGERPIFGAFGDSAPDRWGRKLMMRAEGRHARRAGRWPRSLTEADYLLGVDDRARQGAFRFAEAPGGPFLASPEGSGVPPLVELPRLLRAADRLTAGSGDDDDLALLLAPGASLGGARPKASVEDRDAQLRIAKFPREQDKWDVPRWEALALSLASRAGIAAAEARIENVAGRGVLIVRRFDRESGRRIPFLSSMTMLGATDHEQRSYQEIAEAIQRHGATPTTDLKELWRRIVFTVLTSNHDDHLRNHGFLRRRDGGWQLSPAYDLNPTPAEAGGRTLATAITAGDGRASLELAFETASYYRITLRDAREVAAEVAAVVSGWRDEASSFGLPRDEQDFMASAFEHAELELARRAST